MRDATGNGETIKPPENKAAQEGQAADLTRACSTLGKCATLDSYLSELKAKGLDDVSANIVFGQHQEMCAQVGSCTMYYGIKPYEESTEPVNYKDPRAYLESQTTGY